MLVSWNWLKQYVALDMPLEVLERRLMMAGLNHESTAEMGGDLAVDLEVTSNRPDCLGHIGIAREVAVIWGKTLKIPQAMPPEGKTPVEELAKVRIECPDLCFRYTARVIRGVKVAPSPSWMARRLQTIGLTPINNVVDVSNYVLMECGQPLHTFDYLKLKGQTDKGTDKGDSPIFANAKIGTVPAKIGTVPAKIGTVPAKIGTVPAKIGTVPREIIVRRPLPGERMEAIDHKTYELAPDMCVIADAENAVAIGGVMGGAATEVSEATTDILVEAAEFDPVSIRTTARQLNLHSDSSYRFERQVDPEGLDWASRRCCELILELGGGELAAGSIDVGRQPSNRNPVVLRFSQLKRILGIDVPPERVRQILLALGNVEANTSPLPLGEGPGVRAGRDQSCPHPNPLPVGEGTITVIPPSWRRDLTREIDMIEEVARIYGYEQIPEDVGVPMAPSARTREDRVLEKIRGVLTASGIDEALTLSVVDAQSSAVLSPWTDAEPLRSLMPVIRGADCLRRSLIPSLLAARRTNESLSNPEIELFEIAKIYLPRPGDLPEEALMLGITSGRDIAFLKGVIEAIVRTLRCKSQLESANARIPLVDPDQSCRMNLGGEILGYAGKLLPEGHKHFDLRGPATVAEIKIFPLVASAELMPVYVPLPAYPAVTRDINLVVDESVRWTDVAATVRANGGPCLERLDYCDTYRDPKRLGEGKKSLLMTITLRWKDGTLTSRQADEIRDRIVAACREKHRAELRA
jgi:phenylalanyl-tRNA synthetase beta chain